MWISLVGSLGRGAFDSAGILGKRTVNNLELEVLQGWETNGKTGGRGARDSQGIHKPLSEKQKES